SRSKLGSPKGAAHDVSMAGQYGVGSACCFYWLCRLRRRDGPMEAVVPVVAHTRPGVGCGGHRDGMALPAHSTGEQPAAHARARTITGWLYRTLPAGVHLPAGPHRRNSSGLGGSIVGGKCGDLLGVVAT